MKMKFIGIMTAVALMAGVAPAKADDGRTVITTIFGAAAGGFLGSQFGKGDGQLVATATGAVLGAAVGHHLGSQNDSYYNAPVDYTPPQTQPTYGNSDAGTVQKTIIIKEKTVKHVIVHKYEPEYNYGQKKKHKNKHWKKKNKHQKKRAQVVNNYNYNQVVYTCNSHSNCWKYN